MYVDLCRLKQEIVFHTSSRLLMTIQDMVMYTYFSINQRSLKSSRNIKVKLKNNLEKVLKFFDQIEVVNT